MTQPQNPVPPRSARPQLFSAPAANAKPNANAKRHADFGPSILATIDGGQARYSAAPARSPLKHVAVMAVLALVVAAAYVGVKFASARVASAPETALAVTTAPGVAIKPVEVPASAAAPAVTAGVASIETVTPVAAATASASAPVTSVVSSLGNIQQALDRAEPAVVPKPKAVEGKRVPTAGATAVSLPATKPVAKITKSNDTDADLLAAMLPYVSRGSAAPTSTAYEKRCGPLAGPAAVDCRAIFCNGRQGFDAACPEPAAPAVK